jgi:hypothetical protein
MGQPSAQTKPATGWLSEWRDVAAAHRQRLLDVSRSQNPVRPGAQTAKILEWASDPKPADYLKTLGVQVENITVRDRGVPVEFVAKEVDEE